MNQDVSNLAPHNPSPGAARPQHVPVSDGVKHEVARDLYRTHAT